ncbi:sortilin-related receptor-like [Coccinella septempunctata]|uniref:sortilin-related receptor-like n=1 Tax=Coccinella septempunctata TaxID=41139 RepID=UPI001D062807|nr:sortilin-related receptor-like [Coccinella septempunctata]
MRVFLIFALVSTIHWNTASSQKNTLSGTPASSQNGLFTFNIDDQDVPTLARAKRDVDADSNITSPINVKVKELDDIHKQLMVHWVREGSSVIVCLARDPSPLSDNTPVNPSSVYISYDYGDTYVEKVDEFKLADGNLSTLEKFYNHPRYNTHFVFADVKHKTIFVTTDYGKTVTRRDLEFSPTDILFHEYYSSTFFVHDKNDPEMKVYLTEDFGNSFTISRDFVIQLQWMKDSNDNQQLIEYRLEPSRAGTVMYSSSMFKKPPVSIYATKVKDIYIKDSYIFTTKEGENGNVDLYVSYKFGVQKKCIFDTQLEKKSYFVVDVTENRALVAVSHGKTVSHLYVSDNLDGKLGQVEFILSLEDVLCYFPNNTWHETLMQLMAEETFADVYKVEGLSGIYIASRVVNKPKGSNLGPQNLGSVITFDHGATWRLIRPPQRDNEGQLISCDTHKNCSLHLSQKFSYLYPDTKTISILSSKSAPGLLIATGVIGNSLKGHYGVYVSSDAGWTWRQTLKDLYFFNMGDHGGLLTAVKYYKSRGQTKHILYSTDEGETWKQAPFHKENLRLYGLMTEPGENTTVFTMFGSLPEYHKWIIIKLDLLKAFQYNCTKDDYKSWSPSQSESGRNYVPCIMGQQRTYQRRMPHSNCYNGLDYDAPISMEPCNCDILDYECDFGFVRTSKHGHCIRNKTVLIDPYKVPEKCVPGQFYNRTKGYRKIQGDMCKAGFEKHYLPDQVPCPFVEIDDFLLFAQRERISRFNLVTRTLEELPVKNLKNVIAIDFDMKNNCVFWADIALDLIGRQCLSNGSAPEILVSSDLASIEGMAFDWISNTLYFVDGMRSKIELIRTDINHSGRMRRTVLGPNVLKKPRGIALHPKHGYLFWTDWSSDNPSVNRADLDGTHLKPLFKKPIVEWPNGITIDYIAERIYWVDAKQDYIASADLHGDDMKYVIRGSEVVSHPFAVAVFKNTMFWDDWKRISIFAADKDSALGDHQNIEVIQEKLVGLMDLKVFSHGIQIGNNTCNPNSCPYLCVGSPSKEGHSCLCPDGMIRLNNDCLCPGNVKPSVNGTCPKQMGTCAPEHFTCADNSCIPIGWKCDGEPDCADKSDEVNCKSQNCPPFNFLCGDGKCIPRFWRCDFSNDCADGSDEIDCPKPNCTKDQFTCSNRRCISMRWKCDGQNDCKDNSDELNCSGSEPKTCRSDEFKCKDGGTICVPNAWKCDGEKDCKDGSDEYNCTNNQCSEDRFFCGPPSNACIYKAWLCDGEIDCVGGKDEQNCSQANIPQKPTLPDLFHAQNGTCTEWMFKCRNEKCIPYWWKCDHSDDCGDGSDEQGCQNNEASTSPTPTQPTPNGQPRACGQNQFQCSDGNCILSSWLCDGYPDCLGGEDEANCSSTCDNKHFRCRKDGSCIQKEFVCDNKTDCPDGTDELNCDLHLPKAPEAPSCAVGLFPCDSSRCLPLSLMCDGRRDCIDGFDELHCVNVTRVYQVLQMGADGKNETSISFYWWLPMPLETILDFLPSISVEHENKWRNMTWTEESQYFFNDLKPFTSYNLTVYVRNRNTSVIFPPANYLIASTKEGVPSEPYNVTVKQLDSSHVFISWNKPQSPNGIINSYEIGLRSADPNFSRNIQLHKRTNTTYILSEEFEHDMVYSFFVIAHNGLHKSQPSEVVTFTFDKNTNLNSLENVTVIGVTNSSITLAWNYTGVQPEGFHVDVTITNHAYPKLEPQTTKENKITISNLSPGVTHQFKIYAYKKHFSGPAVIVAHIIKGKPLPEIGNIRGTINSTEAVLTWEKLHDDRNADWIYGVYYGIEAMDLFNKPKLETTNLTATISQLAACETYTFTVGVVGPLGYGPLSRNWIELTTSPDPKAPPKKLTVTKDDGNPLRMKLRWIPSCETSEGVSYIIKVYNQITNKTSRFGKKKIDGTPFVQHVFDVSYGGIYNVSVSTNETGAQFTAPMVYYAPPILPPYEVKVWVENNGSYILYWQERKLSPLVGSYKYEVVVTPGNTFNENSSERYLVDKPPFIYTNFTGTMYTFGVRLITHENFTSLVSERVSMSNDYKKSVTLARSSVSTVIIAVVTLFVLLSVAIGVLFVRHRRLQRSFSRFTNSHYDTRSDAATFDDNHGLEDDIPRIQGFSDDEPLVIA